MKAGRTLQELAAEPDRQKHAERSSTIDIRTLFKTSYRWARIAKRDRSPFACGPNRDVNAAALEAVGGLWRSVFY